MEMNVWWHKREGKGMRNGASGAIIKDGDVCVVAQERR